MFSQRKREREARVRREGFEAAQNVINGFLQGAETLIEFSRAAVVHNQSTHGPPGANRTSDDGAASSTGAGVRAGFGADKDDEATTGATHILQDLSVDRYAKPNTYNTDNKTNSGGARACPSVGENGDEEMEEAARILLDISVDRYGRGDGNSKTLTSINKRSKSGNRRRRREEAKGRGAGDGVESDHGDSTEVEEVACE